MLRQTRHTEWNPNAFEWNVPKDRARQFEDFVAYYLKRSLSGLAADIHIKQTPGSGDQGRDIELSFASAFDLAGVAVTPGRWGRLFIECKSTSHQALDDGFLADVSQHIDAKFDAYVLVTNAVISPSAQYRAVHSWGKLGARFILIDRARLYRAWDEAGLLSDAQRLGLGPKQPPPDLMTAGLCAAAQSEGVRTASGQFVQTYLAVRNFTTTSQRFALSLASDLNWSGEFELDMVLGPGEDTIQLIRSERERLDARAALRLVLHQEGRSANLVVLAAAPELVLEPPFIGGGHRNLQHRLRDEIENGRGLRILSIHGEAGVGKTRTVEEALRPAEGSRFVFRLACDARSGRFDIARLGEDIAAAAFRQDEPQADRPAQLTELVGYLDRIGLPAVILLEDLHHADPEDIAALKSLVLSPPAVAEAIVLIVTGRDDHTFPNLDYFAFLELIRGGEYGHVSGHSLERFTAADSQELIRAVAVDLPEIAVDRVQRLGQDNPFVIIEVLQYLLDVGLARLLSRRTIGVLDPERFKGLDSLPAAVDELYERRLESLRSADSGDAAWTLLCAASFLSADAMDELFSLWTSPAREDAAALLVARRFAAEDPRTGRLQFAHENLYHFFRRWVREPARSAAIANELLHFSELISLLADLPRAELLSLAARHPEAFALFSPIWTKVHSMTNFSSEEIDRSYYPFLPALFISAQATGAAAADLAKVACALGYMAVHNFPLLHGERACGRAEAMIDSVYAESDAGADYRMAIGQLRSHALQNMGRTGVALRRMMELEAKLKESDAAPAALSFDLYDRLQEHYRKVNHRELMDHYGHLAAGACERTKDGKIEAAHLITMSLTRMYRRGGAAVAGAERAIKASEEAGIQRFIVFNKLSRLIAGILAGQRSPTDLRETFEEAQALLRLATFHTYSDSIIRLQLLLATLAPHVHQASEGQRVARTYVAAGQESSVRFGIGLYDWALDNLAGSLDHDDPEIPDEQARRRFATCLERLRRRGLTFVGACGGTYPNVHALANIIRFRASYRESDAADLIRREISAYDTQLTTKEEAIQPLVEGAVAGRAVFWPKGHVEMLRLPGEDRYFTPIF